MKPFYASVAFAVALVGFSSPAVGAIQLVPVVTSGITSPTFVGHAGDGSNRLFILEQAGIVDVLQPGSGTPTMFLDIRSKVKSGGEQGLLGLAFHPDYKNNGRFFVFYTRTGDGTLVIAEYTVSSANGNLADPTEKIILTIPHPTNTNHNGGMLAFGSDGFLYIGVGDGGSANDPPNNAQNKDVLLGKILRIDIDHAQGPGVPYVSPPDNPFVNDVGADEIFALGMRNPWRFSFDRTGPPWQPWVADVGQGSREEVDTPIVKGGNYGWRVYEGTSCTNNDPSLCSVPPNYIPPTFDYLHSNGRCSITGGYVYRGSLATFSTGTYVYGDYCSGEIFAWDGTTQTVLLDTTLNISSFGEDEQGELYVVHLGGSISRIVSTTPCTYSINPTSQSFGSNGGTDNVAVSAGSGCSWNAASNASWVQVTSGANGTGNGSVGYSVDANSSASSRTGTMTIAGLTFTVNQTGAATCTYAIAPTRATFQVDGGSGTVMVTAPAGCGWTAVSNATWITITAGASGSGNDVVTYSVAQYTGKPRNRNGTMTIAGQTFSIKQSR
jgi:glucose/arabinose dehydrogenase